MSKSKTEQSAIATNIEDGVVIDGFRMISLKTPIEDIVTLQGSFLGGEVYSPSSNTAVAEITAEMLDEGTTKRDKFVISRMLEDVGASISIWAGKYRIRFKAMCLKKDVPLVIDILGEQLRSPAFNKTDLEPSIKRRIGDLKRSKEETSVRAMEAFLQELYPEDHPNYSVLVNKQIKDTGKVKESDLKKFHRLHYGLGNLIMVAVGDVDRSVFEKAIHVAFSGWGRSGLTIDLSGPIKAKRIRKPRATVVNMRDKTSADLVIGQPIGIDREHEDFLPLMIGHYILGGNFSARLMATTRDEEGLTYGIRSALGGIENGNDGYWYIWGTFAPELMEQGRESTLFQLNKWVDEGVTEEELAAKKTTITGTYQVTLATTGGLANRIMSIAERGKEMSYIDEFPQEICSIQLRKVNEVIRQYSNPKKLVFVSAGSIEVKGNQ
ncbi:MAG: insulinase family protein [Candidatus Marinimicrobia bacterium]|nr:insulinase family protein [Candidatus Neomarinimicrobiota bacterium]